MRTGTLEAEEQGRRGPGVGRSGARARSASVPGALAVALALLLAAVPWPLGANRPWAWSGLWLATASLLALTGAAILLGLARPARLPGSIRLALLLALLVALWVVLQAGPAPWPEAAHPVWALLPADFGAVPAIAIDPPAAREALLRLLTAIGLVILGYVAGADRDRSERLCVLALVVIGAQAAFALLRVVMGWDELFGRRLPLERISGSFVNPNHFAAYVNLGTVIAAVLLLRAARGDADSPRLGSALARVVVASFQARPLLAGALLLCLLATAASGSRGAALALVPTLLVLLAVALRGARRPLLLVGLAGLAAAAGWAVTTGGELLWARLIAMDPASAFSPGIEGRLLAWSFTLEQILARPWLGHGYGGFLALFNHARDERFAPGLLWDYVHNSYLELAVELGLPAALLLALAVILVHLPCLGAIRRGTQSPLPLVALMATLVQALHALVDFGWQIPAVNATWAVLVGLAAGRSALTLERRAHPARAES